MSDDKIAVLIKKASLDFDKISNQLLAPYDLTPTQFKILMLLYKEPPYTVRQIDLEKYFSMTNPTVTGIMQNLEKKDMVARVPNPQDGRSKVLALTQRAHDMRRELLALADTLEQSMTKNLSDEEKQQLTMLLKKMMDRRIWKQCNLQA